MKFKENISPLNNFPVPEVNLIDKHILTDRLKVNACSFMNEPPSRLLTAGEAVTASNAVSLTDAGARITWLRRCIVQSPSDVNYRETRRDVKQSTDNIMLIAASRIQPR